MFCLCLFGVSYGQKNPKDPCDTYRGICPPERPKEPKEPKEPRQPKEPREPKEPAGCGRRVGKDN